MFKDPNIFIPVTLMTQTQLLLSFWICRSQSFSSCLSVILYYFHHSLIFLSDAFSILFVFEHSCLFLSILSFTFSSEWNVYEHKYSTIYYNLFLWIIKPTISNTQHNVYQQSKLSCTNCEALKNIKRQIKDLKGNNVRDSSLT